MMKNLVLFATRTVNSRYSGHPRDRDLVYVIVRVHNSGSLFQSNVCNITFAGDLAAVRNSGVSARRELTVVILNNLTISDHAKYVNSRGHNSD